MTQIFPNKIFNSSSDFKFNPDFENYFIENLSDLQKNIVRVASYNRITNLKVKDLEFNISDYNKYFKTKALTIQELNQKINEGDHGFYTARLTLSKFH